MPMRYAHQDDVLSQIELDPENPDNADDIKRVERLENGLAETFDSMVGRSFGAAPMPETRLLEGQRSPFLVVSGGIRSVTGIRVGGDWDGEQWTGGREIDRATYALWGAVKGVAYSIYHRRGEWEGAVRVTGIWADQVTEEIPDDVREALTFLTVEEYRTRNASPAGYIGPDGLMIPTRNPWNFRLVQQAIERHRVVQVVV